MSDFWLKALGTSNEPLDDAWRDFAKGLFEHAVTSRRKHKIRPGDGIVLYATRHGVVFGVGTATSLAYLDKEDDRHGFPWRVNIQLDHSRDFLHDGVPLDVLNVDERDLRRSVRQRSAIRLSAGEFQAARKALSTSPS